MRWFMLAPLVLSVSVHAQVTSLAHADDPSVGPAGADNAMLISISNHITPATPSCEVLVSARWQPDLRQFAAAIFDVYTDPDAGDLHDPERYLKGPGTKNGVVAPDGDSVTEIISGQLCWPLECYPEVCPNPQRLWRATWSTDDFTPRIVRISTVTMRFDVYFAPDCSAYSFEDVLEEGTAEIIVGCSADCDQNTVLDRFDFLCFVEQFNAGAPEADCDGDGSFTLFDFLCFVNEFNAGC